MANRVRAHRRAARERVRRRSIQRTWRENVHQLAASREPEAMAQEMKERDIKKEESGALLEKRSLRSCGGESSISKW